MKTIQICEGLNWETIEHQAATSYFPEGGFADLSAAGIGDAMRNADVTRLTDVLDERVGADEGSNGAVWAIRDHPDVLVKFSDRPFSYTAVNAALEAGWSQHSLYNTPHYLGAIIAPGINATVMSRATGVSLSNVNHPKPNILGDGEYLDRLHSGIKHFGQQALRGVGINPSEIMWDLNVHNILANAHHSYGGVQEIPVTILDQESSRRLGAHDWHSIVGTRHTVSERDPRDIEAELASERAWAKLMANA